MDPLSEPSNGTGSSIVAPDVSDHPVRDSAAPPTRAAERALGYGGYLALVGVYYLASLWILPPARAPQVAMSWTGALLLTLTLGTGYLLTIVLATVFRTPRSSAELAGALKERVWTPIVAERLAGIFLLGGGVMVMFDVFASLKPFIPDLHPYSWDVALAEADRLLHFGRDPWRWLHALPGRDVITSLLDWTYVQWYELMVAALLVALVALPFGQRLRFFYGFVALWIVGGTLVGTLFASGGPVYYGPLTGDPNRFRELFAYLDGAAPIARSLQNRLWQAFVTPGGDFPFEGISAMPSLHVAVAAYVMFWSWRSSLVLRLGTALYAAIVFLGSVDLGWHYALDGYVGILIAWACWRGAVRLASERRGGPHRPRSE